MLSDSESYDTEKIVCIKLLQESLTECLKTLSPRERKVLKLYFGLETGKKQTNQQVADFFGVSQERIRQIKAKSFRKLRHPKRSNKFRDYLEIF